MVNLIVRIPNYSQLFVRCKLVVRQGHSIVHNTNNIPELDQITTNKQAVTDTQQILHNRVSSDEKKKKLLLLRERIQQIDNISYKTDKLVFGEGNLDTKIMVIGEAPGEKEESQLRPFVGKSGQLLRTMLHSAQLHDLYITNIMPWRPPNNRTPSIEEMSIMKSYIEEHINIIQPQILILVGGVAYMTITGNKTAISKVRGQIFQHNNIKTMAIFHPSYLLRAPANKRVTWNDLLCLTTLNK